MTQYAKNYLKLIAITCAIVFDLLIIINFQSVKTEWTKIYDEWKSSHTKEETVVEINETTESFIFETK